MLQTLPSRRTVSARPASPATGAYKVDISRGERIGRVSSEWFSRPDDERYLSLGALHAAVRARAERATARTVETKAVRVEASRDDAEHLTLIVPGQDTPVAPTHWSYGQLCSLVGAPASYMRQLPAPLAGINLQHGLLSHRAELVKTLEADDGRIELRAVTGPDYGRIWDHELVEAVMKIAGDGTGDTRWKVPGLLDWSTMTHNPFVEVTKDTTTLYASDRLANNAEAVCRHYLSNGRREGRWWTVGDIHNTPGRSTMVRLKSTDRGSAGKWTDAATGEHGDLLDLIAQTQGCATLADTLDEARRFLSLPRPESREPVTPAPQGSPEAARRLFAMSKPIRGTIVETYLRTRGITDLRDCTSLRFHPRCYYRGNEDDPTDAPDTWPALIAAATDLTGAITGVHRTWLHPSGQAKAPVATPRRSMGMINSQGVRIGRAGSIVAVGEGLETTLSLRVALPDLPIVAAGSANHLDALLLPEGLHRLYVAEDDDPAGRRATASVMTRAEAVGIEAMRLTPALGDFNDDLRQCGREALHTALRVQLAPEDVERFWMPALESVRAA